MRNEAIWLVQFLATVTVLGVTFGAGMWVGARRRSRSGPAGWDNLPAAVEVRAAVGGRRDLFAPEIDLRDDGADGTDAVRGELSPGR